LYNSQILNVQTNNGNDYTNYFFSTIFTKNIKYNTTKKVATAEIIKVVLAPNLYQINPANELANMVQTLWKPA
jgi:hypothetical protein